MAFDIGNTLHAVETYIQKLGLFQYVQIGEPKQPLGQGYHAAIFMNSVGVGAVYAGGETRESHSVTLRVYRDMLAEELGPQRNLEGSMAAITSKVMADLVGDSDLESTVMAIDVAGMDGQGLRVDFGYIEVGGVIYRTADILIPLIVNGSATVAGTGV